MTADSRDRKIDPRQWFGRHLDTLRQSVGFDRERGTQQPVSYFLAASAAVNVVDLNVVPNGGIAHEDFSGLLSCDWR
jgi:hypothetical protein